MLIQYIKKPILGELIIEIERSLTHYKSVELLNRTIDLPIVQNLTRFLREDPNTNDVMVAFNRSFSTDFGLKIYKEIYATISQNLTLIDFIGPDQPELDRIANPALLSHTELRANNLEPE